MLFHLVFGATMTTATLEARLTRLWETPKTLYGWFATVDHKELGLRYLVTAVVFLIVGGLEALLKRLQLAQIDLALLSPEAYNQIFTMHGVTMIFWYASPILSGFAVYLVPLMIGARDMAFPRLNTFTYRTYLSSGIFISVPSSVKRHTQDGSRMCHIHSRPTRRVWEWIFTRSH
jgi:heme/copper-type cytochrome/quinol oxidase subunit 1